MSFEEIWTSYTKCIPIANLNILHISLLYNNLYRCESPMELLKLELNTNRFQLFFIILPFLEKKETKRKKRETAFFVKSSPSPLWLEYLFQGEPILWKETVEVRQSTTKDLSGRCFRENRRWKALCRKGGFRIRTQRQGNTRSAKTTTTNYSFSPEVDVKIKTQIKNPKRRIKEAKKEICQREQASKLRSFEKTTRWIEKPQKEGITIKEKDQISSQLKRQKKRNATRKNKKKFIFYLDGSILSKSYNIKSYALMNSLLMSSNVRQRMGFLFPFDSLNRYLQ